MLMKNHIYLSLVIALMVSSMSCAPRQGGPPSGGTPRDGQLARRVLLNFLESLHNGNYDEAAQLYGGSYETMMDHNPATNREDRAALLRNACVVNGGQCLEMRSAGLDRKVSNKEFVFKADFSNADGTLFVLGPCCGASEADSPSRSIFRFTVMKTGQDKFVVMDMPPYAP